MLAPTPPFRVMIIGGSYGGLSAALNLWDLTQARLPRSTAARKCHAHAVQEEYDNRNEEGLY